jgi:hypothetical protein
MTRGASVTQTPGPYFHGDLGRQPPSSAMAALDDRVTQVRWDFAGRPEGEVLVALRRLHEEMGLGLDPMGGPELAREIAESPPCLA